MQTLRVLLATAGLVLGALAIGGAAAQEQPESGPEVPESVIANDDKLITMDFQGVELPALVKFISEITGRNFILDEKVKGKVTIISPRKISVDEAYAVFQSVLQVKGFTTVPSGSINKIVPAQEAKSSTVETVMPGVSAAGGDEVITKLMPLQNVDVNNMLPIIQPLVSASGLLAAYAATNTLIMIDSASNIERISRILHVLDVEGFERGVEVVRLNYAFANEMAATLAQVLAEPAGEQAAIVSAPGTTTTRRRQTAAERRAARSRSQVQPGVTAGGAGGAGEQAYNIIPDQRTNSLIIVAGPLEMRRIKDLIVRLDVPLPFGTGRIHVYYLKYANAFEIVPVLSDLIGGTGGIGGIGGGLLSRRLSGSTTARGGRLGQRGGLRGLTGEDFGGNLGSMGGLGGLGFGSRSQRGFGGSAGGLGGSAFGGPGGVAGGVTSVTGGGQGDFEGEVRITADPSTNALIINASPQDYETLKQVIVQLDVRRRQVYVEAIIMEVRLEANRDLGIELQGSIGLDKGVAFGRTNFANINSAITNPAGLPGLIAAVASNQTVRLPDGTVVPAQAVLLTASQASTDVNILSAPNILTTDNQEAEIVVGQNIPFLASRSTSETNLANTFATIERRDVGITLRLTPQITEGGMVRLEIFQEVSAVVPSAVIDANQLGPVTTIRSATTSVVVRDDQTVVIGGLISDGVSNRETSVPFLSDIPVLGNFLRSSSGRREKINLLIFLTPHIIRSPREHRDSSLQQRDKLKAFMEEHHFRRMRREHMDAPTWNPDLPEEEPASGDDAQSGDGERSSASDSTGTVPPDYAVDFVPADGRPNTDSPDVRYVLLAGFSERGNPPLGLQSASGLLAVALNEGSQLRRLFREGGRYRFSSDNFEGLYQCLEAYPTDREALLVYPEGLPVDQSKGEFLHWREFKDASSANAAAWTALE